MSTAGEYDAAMQSYLETDLVSWISDNVIVTALKDQNETSVGYDQSAIDAMDQEWRAQVGTDNAPLVEGVLGHGASDFLRSRVEASGGVITEIFIMDSVGLNVAASDPTSDMWQGDEDKFQKTYPMGAGASHFGDVEFDESSQRYQGQISVAISDPATGEVIGAITIGVDAEALL